MLLEQLNNEESSALLNLVSEFAMSDNKFTKEEKQIINEYKKELGISEMEKMPHEMCVDILKKSTDKIKIFTYMKLMRTALVDGEYEFGEVEFLEKLSEELEISRAKKMEIANYFFNYPEDADIEKGNEDLEKILGE